MKFLAARPSTALLLFVALFGCYISLSPGLMAPMGYSGEEILCADRMLAIVNAWRQHVTPPPMLWARHGLLPIFFDVPFVAAGKVVATPDFIMSFEPVLATAGLGVVLFLWLRKLTSPGMSLLLALTAAFCTMLWPYAYIGLETKQSFFVLLAGYLALARGKIDGSRQIVLFAIVCGLAISLKSTGFTLVPAIAYLVYVQFRQDWRPRLRGLAAVVLIIGVIWLAAAISRVPFWAPLGGPSRNLRGYLADSPFTILTNAIGIFGSPTRGLFVNAPVLLLALYAVPLALRSHQRVAIFALLVTAAMTGWLSLLRAPTDEVWGTRYMHVTIAPLILCVGAVRSRFNWRKDAALIALAAVGLMVAFLGAFYYYGVLHAATLNTGQNTAEWMAGDSVWNPIVFHARLFRVWLDGSRTPVLWTPSHIWMYDPPPDMPPWKTIDLRAYAEPQAGLLRMWHTSLRGRDLLLFSLYLSALGMGLTALGWAIRNTVLEERELPRAREIAMATKS